MTENRAIDRGSDRQGDKSADIKATEDMKPPIYLTINDDPSHNIDLIQLS